VDYQLDMAISHHRELIRRAEQIARLKHGEAEGWNISRARLLDGDRVLSHRSLFAFRGQRLVINWRSERRWSVT